MSDDATKRCRKCGEVKPLSEFYRKVGYPDGHMARCKACHSRARRESYANHPDPEERRQRRKGYEDANRESIRATARRRYANNPDVAAYQREYVRTHPEVYRDSNRREREKARQQVFDHYGRQCACPGCGAADNLTIDHVNGEGGEHRKELFGTQVGGWVFYLWLIRNDFPDGYQTLCAPCNLSKGKHKMCSIEH